MNSIKYRDEDFKLTDGILLKSRIWLPNGEGPWPALVMRQPYGREIASTVTYAHPDWWAQKGYLVVIQDVRGQGSSEGDFHGFSQEAADTSETINWVRSLPECNGLLGTYGFSYQGLTQLLATEGTPPPDCIAPAMTGLSEFEHWSCEGGAFWWHLGIGWGLQLAAQKAKREKNIDAWHEIRESLESKKYLSNDHKLIEKHDPNGMANRWLKLSTNDLKDWKIHQPLKSWLKKPLLLIGGWWDPHLRGILDIFEKSKKAGGDPKLIIGPASHLQWWEGLQITQLKFFDNHLKPTINKNLLPQINLWNQTTKTWEICNHPTENQIWKLQSDGLACISSNEGKLILNSEAGRRGEVKIVHDPWRPVPAIGGHLGEDPGEKDRGSIDIRSDVAVFTSSPLIEALRIEGIPSLSFDSSCDRESFDMFVSLSILPRNTKLVRQLSTGAMRIKKCQPNTKQYRTIKLQPIFADLKKDDRLRISISGSAWPAIGINSGFKQYVCEGSVPHCLVTTISLILTNSKLEFKSLIST